MVATRLRILDDRVLDPMCHKRVGILVLADLTAELLEGDIGAPGVVDNLLLLLDPVLQASIVDVAHSTTAFAWTEQGVDHSV